MKRRALLAAILAVPVASGVASAPARAAESCTGAANIVERQLGLPPGLLASIGKVETGNNPFAVDSDGAGTEFATAEDAVDFVRRGAGSARFVDVGCFQVDLAFHPNAFRTLEDAFDPVSNATEAGRFLLELRRNASSWSEAVARYHSGQPGPGSAYAARVYASLGPGGGAGSFDVGPAVAGIRIIVPTSYVMAGSGRSRALDQARGLPVVQTP